MRILFATTLALALAASSAVAWTGAECPGDVNGDGTVAFDDLLVLLNDWGCDDCASDLDGNGITEFPDLLILLNDWGCVAPQVPVTTLSGNVTNLWTGDPVVGATITVGEDVVTTNASGDYSGDFPVGLHTVLFEAGNFLCHEQDIVLFPDLPLVLDVALEPVAPVVVTVQIDGDIDPGDTVLATAIVDVLDGSTIENFAWTQAGGTPADLLGVDAQTIEVVLGGRFEYKQQLFHVLAEPPIAPEDLPPNVPPPDGEFPGGLQNRWQVVGVNPFALEEAGLVTLDVEVTTTSGVYGAEGEMHTPVPWHPSLGIRNAPIGVPVLIGGKEQATYNWVLSPPAGSGTTLVDATTRFPEFVPDLVGAYDLSVTDLETGQLAAIKVWAGTWRGIIVGQDIDGRPISDPSCTSCHMNIGQDKFTPWAQTGHAEIFTNNLDNSTHYGSNCFSCHTIGYAPGVANNGFDNAPDYQAFLDAGLLNNPGDNWTTMLAEFPAAAKLANVQCESCHGPQDGGHTQAEFRRTLSSDGCATCHGEPLRHARFQQWQLSGHADYELAIDEGESGNCSRCHTANGFLEWYPILNGDEPGDPLDDITVNWGTDDTHPQTCVTCHDPHNIGTTSGINTNATIRVTGNTPPLIAGFTAFGVGDGAMCMTCHNSRRGLRNDSVFDQYYGTSEAARAPHGSAQTDVLMGENAYLTTVGIRGNHSFLEDTCVKCHMESTPPPDQLSYNSGGTNHTFFARRDICSECHAEGSFTADGIQGGVEDTLHVLQDLMEEKILGYMGEQIALGHVIDLNGDAQIVDLAQVADLEFGEARGRQAITVTFTDATVIGPMRLTDVDILDADLMLIEAFYDSADPALIKAGWNYNLIHNDGSLGVHNPTYSYMVLTSAIAALDPLAALEAPDWLDFEPGGK